MSGGAGGGRLSIGAAGWSYDDWRGGVYPEGTPRDEYLPVYSSRYRTVEVDSSYYHVPSVKVARGWRERTPEGFRFALKFPKRVVHAGEVHPDPEGVLRGCDDEVAALVEAADALGDKLGALLLQFPFFNRTAFKAPGQFLERLIPFTDALPRRFPLAIEVRNKAWLVSKLLDPLRERKIVLVLADQAWMPGPLELRERLPELLTGAFAYVRLIGDRDATELELMMRALRTHSDAELKEANVDLARVETAADARASLRKMKMRELDAIRWREVVVDRGERLKQWSILIRDLLDRGIDIVTYVNNHFAGHAPSTIRELEALLGVDSGGL